MELRTLRYFVAVAKHCSFSAASEALHISQPALSRQIKALESHFGLRLFHRLGRSIELTHAGREVLDQCHIVLGQIEALETRTRGMVEGLRGQLRIGMAPHTLESVMAQVLPPFQDAHPELDLILVEDGASGLLRRLAEGDLDLAISGLGPAAHLRGRALFPLGLLTLMHPDHCLAQRTSVNLHELARETLLLLSNSFMTRTMFDAACRIAQIEPHVAIESSSASSLAALVENGMGTAIIPSTVALPSKLAAVPVHLNRDLLGFWVHIVWDPRRALPDCARPFIDAVAEHTRHNYPGQNFGFESTLGRPDG